MLSSRPTLICTGLILTQALLACSPVEDASLFPEFDAATAKAPVRNNETPYNPQRNLYWGDLHVHTGLSSDAYTNGVRTTPDDAYTFFKGGEIEHAAGYAISIRRPLDFAAVTDHSEYLGVLWATKPDMPLNRKSLRDHLLGNGRLRNSLLVAESMFMFSLEGAIVPGWEAHAKSAWDSIIAAAERNNDPGRFTAFIGYEWSSMPDSQNLHRNVIYRGSKVPDIPFSSIDSEDPRDLWRVLEAQRQQGMAVFAIPHNGNLSNGKMYDSVMFDGTEMNADYARQRMINEPISEIFQVKGSSETYPRLSPQDEFADFEIYDTQLARHQRDSQPEGSYMRDALRTGLEMSHSEGFNPYRFGVIGSSDSHNASSPVDEDRYHGKLPLLDGSAGLRMGAATFFPEESMVGGLRWGSAGLAAVWAEENTRGALFDAMRRKETYATSGTRIGVRFFGGWNYPQDLMNDSDWIATAERGGVPMGGDLPPPSAAAPSFAVWAIRDPDSGNLDRIQIVKGWVDSAGQSHEQVFNVAWSGERQRDTRGALPAVGNTVDVASASYRNDIGAAQLATVWRDPQFDPDVEAFYYARVIEIPTPRWSTFDAKRLGIPAPEPSSIAERAVTSAIWYRPDT